MKKDGDDQMDEDWKFLPLFDAAAAAAATAADGGGGGCGGRPVANED